MGFGVVVERQARVFLHQPRQGAGEAHIVLAVGGGDGQGEEGRAPLERQAGRLRPAGGEHDPGGGVFHLGAHEVGVGLGRGPGLPRQAVAL